MDVVNLEKKRTEAEARFNELLQQKASIDVEMNRLQGAYSAYGDLIQEIDETIPQPAPDPTSVIDVEESLNQESEGSENGSE